ncbi:glucosamine inositolphosphorylceramide transferase family protein [Autumnicola musiva]|uniref:Glucosamine inositolphosphorylceramide transferase 1 N-terminal domain-containing protein n=1 Tax=Autumnicola musiva TaxID=3075589 RepID=A0ABU3D5H1_9FLAO|nr:hypothetical protein [Zunongwangia sp. F117]MDT0676784.1 hypothetical protein [Zunongwangia sp. F117]
MRRKFFTYLGIFLLVGIFMLLILNFKYPFINSVVGKWSVGYSFNDEVLEKPVLDPDNIISYPEVDSILDEPGHYIADPFFIMEKDTFYLFVELKGKKDADIALFTSPDGEDYQYKGVVLDEPFHLSFPQVFKHKDEFYMFPETNQCDNVILYKSADFPYKWQKIDTLIKNRKLKDPATLLSEDLNLIVAVDEHMQQYMFTADSLSGAWNKAEDYTGRLGNETRPGGRFFEFNGNHYLPIQDRRYGYGSAISIFRLANKDNHLELIREEREYLGPKENIKWFNRGMHQIDIQKVNENYYMVYDGDYNKNGETYFQYKRTLKFIYSDFYNLFH